MISIKKFIEENNIIFGTDLKNPVFILNENLKDFNNKFINKLKENNLIVKNKIDNDNPIVSNIFFNIIEEINTEIGKYNLEQLDKLYLNNDLSDNSLIVDRKVVKNGYILKNLSSNPQFFMNIKNGEINLNENEYAIFISFEDGFEAYKIKNFENILDYIPNFDFNSFYNSFENLSINNILALTNFEFINKKSIVYDLKNEKIANLFKKDISGNFYVFSSKNLTNSKLYKNITNDYFIIDYEFISRKKIFNYFNIPLYFINNTLNFDNIKLYKQEKPLLTLIGHKNLKIVEEVRDKLYNQQDSFVYEMKTTKEEYINILNNLII